MANDINYMFDDLSGISEVKNFEQSQPKPVSIFDSPESFQEFDEIEHEIRNTQHSITEMQHFHDVLEEKKAVSQQDRIALESILSDVEELPMVAAYTRLDSRVNLTVTQESILGNVKKGLAWIAKKLWEFIVKCGELIRSIFFDNIFQDNYTTGKKSSQNRDRAEKKAKQAQKKYEEVKDVQIPVEEEPHDELSQAIIDAQNQRHEREDLNAKGVVVRSELKRMLYGGDGKFVRKPYKTLYSLEGKRPIFFTELMYEMYQQRIGPFYTELWYAISHQDVNIAGILWHTREMFTNHSQELIDRSLAVIGKSNTQIDPQNFESLFVDVPERVMRFNEKYSAYKQPNRDKDRDEYFNPYAEAIKDSLFITNTITDLRSVRELDVPVNGVLFDTTWVGDLFDPVDVVGIKHLQDEFEKFDKAAGKIDLGKADLDDDQIRVLKIIKNDWNIVMNAIFIYTKINNSINALWANYEDISIDIENVADCLKYFMEKEEKWNAKK